MGKRKELLLGGKKVGETSFLSKHCEDGVFEWGASDGRLMHDGLKKYAVRPRPLLQNRKAKKNLAIA